MGSQFNTATKLVETTTEPIKETPITFLTRICQEALSDGDFGIIHKGPESLLQMVSMCPSSAFEGAYVAVFTFPENQQQWTMELLRILPEIVIELEKTFHHVRIVHGYYLPESAYKNRSIGIRIETE
jgi:hypothetical protein